LCLTSSAEEFPWDHLRKIFCRCQRMAKVPNSVEILSKISTAWVGCTSVTDRLTDDRQTTDGRATANSSLSLKSNTFKLHEIFCTCYLWPWLGQQCNTLCTSGFVAFVNRHVCPYWSIWPGVWYSRWLARGQHGFNIAANRPTAYAQWLTRDSTGDEVTMSAIALY